MKKFKRYDVLPPSGGAIIIWWWKGRMGCGGAPARQSPSMPSILPACIALASARVSSHRNTILSGMPKIQINAYEDCGDKSLLWMTYVYSEALANTSCFCESLNKYSAVQIALAKRVALV